MSDNSNSSDEFEVLFAEITKDEQTVGTAAVTEQTTEAQLVSKPEPEATELPDIKQDPKPARYSEIPAISSSLLTAAPSMPRSTQQGMSSANGRLGTAISASSTSTSSRSCKRG